ncbi:MAG: acetylornithine transaminase [Actinomycetota bacterium]
MSTYKRVPVKFVRGEGTRLFDDAGNEYLDLLAGIAVSTLGHAHPAVVEAITGQAQNLIHVSNFYRTGPQERLAAELARLSGGFRSFFCNSGAEAIEAALKLARKWGAGSRTEVVCAEEGFHGRTFGALSATGQPAKQAPFEPLVPGFTHVPYGDASALEAALSDRVCAVLLEPIQGEAGVVVPPDGYLAQARALCDEWGALLIFDEIQTGFARTGAWFAHQSEGVVPDVMCLAKALGGGLPLGACLAREEAAGVFAPGDHASTFGGGPVQCAAALATIDVIEREGLVQRAAEAGGRLSEALEKVVAPHASVRGRGLLIGVVFEQAVAGRVVEQLFAKRVLANNATEHVLRLAPPLVITDDELERAVECVREAVDAVV